MRSPLLSATALALLLPVTGQAAPKPTKPVPQHNQHVPGPTKIPTQPSAKPFNPERPHLPQPKQPRIDPSKVYLPQVPIKGDLTCRRGDADCNPCTADVRGQFAKMRRGESNWRGKPWRFEWGKSYAPDSTRPYEAFDEDSHLANGLGLSDAHAQAFIRTNEGPAWYAGLHSQKEEERPGTVFIIEQDSSGKKRLAALHVAKTRHPSGLHVLGRYILFGERKSRRELDLLRVIDLRRRMVHQDISHQVPEAVGESRALKQFGGGLGSAKLSDGSYLLVSTVPGDRKTEQDGSRVHRYNQFYNMKGDLTDPEDLTMRFLAEQRFSPTTAVPQKYEFSENLSLVTECTTGDIYAMHSSGDGEGLSGLEGRGY